MSALLVSLTENYKSGFHMIGHPAARCHADAPIPIIDFNVVVQTETKFASYQEPTLVQFDRS